MEVIKQGGSTSEHNLLVPTNMLPSPILSPSLSTDEDSVYSPSNQTIPLDDLLDWDGQQQVLHGSS